MFFARPILLVSCLGLTAALIGCSGSSVLSKAGKFYDKDGPPDSSHSFSAKEHTALKVEKPYKAANRPYTVMGKRTTRCPGTAPFLKRASPVGTENNFTDAKPLSASAMTCLP